MEGMHRTRLNPCETLCPLAEQWHCYIMWPTFYWGKGRPGMSMQWDLSRDLSWLMEHVFLPHQCATKDIVSDNLSAGIHNWLLIQSNSTPSHRSDLLGACVLWVASGRPLTWAVGSLLRQHPQIWQSHKGHQWMVGWCICVWPLCIYPHLWYIVAAHLAPNSCTTSTKFYG